MNSPRVVVIGAGAAGLLAAGSAAESGADVLLLEKGPRTARKVRISGKGRCNLTNTADIREFIEAFGPNGRFLYGAFSRFFRDDLIELLNGQGVETKVERGGRVFPVSDRASDVADALERWALEKGARLRPNIRALDIELCEGLACGVRIYGGTIRAQAVVVATGGASYPGTGSTGDGYAIAARLGHTITPPQPALSPLEVCDDWVKSLQGLSLRNVEASVLVRDSASSSWRRVDSEFGEMLFTHFGVSGPIVLTLSRAVRNHIESHEVALSIDLKPALSPEQLHARLIRDFVRPRMFRAYLRELLPKLLAETFPALCGIEPAKTLNRITAPERNRLVELLKDLRLSVARLRPLEDAIVTAGGVAIGEIDPRTMMSRIVPGVFFAGEVIDIDAKTGGYNLQAAFSTGYVAGRAAAQYALSCRR